MGCGGSKVDDLPLVKLCKERKDLIKAASDHRYALGAAHISYFRSLKHVGDALRKFVDEELVIGDTSSSSPPDSPLLTLPSDEGKGKNKNNNKNSSSSTSISHSLEGKEEGFEEGSHLHLSSDSDDSELDSSSGHIRIHDSPEPEVPYYSNFTSFIAPPWNPPPPHSHSTPGGANNSNYTSYNTAPPPTWNNPPPPRAAANNLNYTSYNTAPPSWNPPPPGADYTSYNTAPQPWNPPPPSADNLNYTSYSESPWNPPRPGANNSNYTSSYNAPPPWNTPPGVNNSYTYYMKRAPTMPTVVYEDPRGFTANAQWQDPSYPSSSYPQYGDGGFYGGVSMGSTNPDPDYNRRQSPPAAAPPVPPSPPEVSPWDFLNIFNGYSEAAGQDYYPRSRYGYGSTTSSPDSNEVREREGIPDLEDETEPEVIKEAHKGKKLREDMNRNSGEGTSGAMPSQYKEGTSRAMPSQYKEGTSRAMPSQYREGTTRGVPSQYGDGTSRSVPLQNSETTSKSTPVQGSEGTYEAHTKEVKSSPDTIVSQSSEEYPRKKAVSFEVGEASTKDNESSKLSTLTTLSTHGTRDLQEVVKEIRDEFETASGHGKEVSMLLEVGKLPYQSKVTTLKVIFSKVLYSIAPSMSSAHPPPGQALQLASRTRKMAKSFYGDGKDIEMKPYYIAKTLDKLYVWEKRLYKEVKDEERLRVIYEKKCKRLKGLDYRGAESNKVEATQALTKQLLGKLKVNIRTIDVISREIHKLRDEVLQPQLAELIQGLIRMWKSVLKCHQKQFQAIVESKTRTLRANTGFRRDSSLRATVELEMELLSWCTHFDSWIKTQKSYVKCLNGWLLRCLLHEPEETPDGVIPFSPSRIGAPQAFIMCNDWFEAMERISESAVADAMRDFALSLHELWVRQDDEQRQRIKAEYLLKDFEKQLTTFRIEKEKLKHDKEEKIAGSMVPSETGVSPLDDLKSDLDTMRKRLQEERGRHKEAIKLVHNAASSSIQSGLTPIFEALRNFASEALKVHEQVRINSTGGVMGDVKDDFQSQTNESSSVL